MTLRRSRTTVAARRSAAACDRILGGESHRETLKSESLVSRLSLFRVNRMELSVSCVTLVVANVATAARFYAALGFSVRERGPVAYLGSDATPAIALATSETLATLGLTDDRATALLSCNLADRAAVETLFDRAVALGGTALAAPHAVPYGIAAWLRDPFGHRWEFVWNPARDPVTPPSAR